MSQSTHIMPLPSYVELVRASYEDYGLPDLSKSDIRAITRENNDLHDIFGAQIFDKRPELVNRKLVLFMIHRYKKGCYNMDKIWWNLATHRTVDDTGADNQFIADLDEIDNDSALLDYTARAVRQAIRASDGASKEGVREVEVKLVLAKEMWKSADEIFALKKALLLRSIREDKDLYAELRRTRPEYPCLSLAYQAAQDVLTKLQYDREWRVKALMEEEINERVEELHEDEVFIIELLKSFTSERRSSTKDRDTYKHFKQVCDRLIALERGRPTDLDEFGVEGNGGRNWEDDTEFAALALQRYFRQVQDVGVKLNGRVVDHVKNVFFLSIHPPADTGKRWHEGMTVLDILREYKRDMEQSQKNLDERVLQASKRLLAFAMNIPRNAKPVKGPVLPSPKDIANIVATTIDLYAMNLRKRLGNVDEEVLEEIETLVMKEDEAEEEEEKRRQNLQLCERDVDHAKSSLLEYLEAYLATVDKQNSEITEDSPEPEEMIDRRLLSALESLIEQAKGKVDVELEVDDSLDFQNNRNWGQGGYAAVISRAYSKAVKATGGEVDREVSDVARVVIERNNKVLTASSVSNSSEEDQDQHLPSSDVIPTERDGVISGDPGNGGNLRVVNGTPEVILDESDLENPMICARNTFDIDIDSEEKEVEVETGDVVEEADEADKDISKVDP